MTSTTAGPKPWHRTLAGVIALVGIGLAAWVLASAGGTSATWSKHVTGAAAVLFFLTGPSAAVAVPRAASRGWALLGWVLPAAVVWFGVEHFTDARAFLTGRGNSLATEGRVHFSGGIIIALGLAALGGYVALTLYAVRRRRDPSLPSVGERVARRTGKSAPRDG